MELPSGQNAPAGLSGLAQGTTSRRVLLWVGVLAVSVLLETLPALHRLDLRLVRAWSRGSSPDWLPNVWSAGMPLATTAAFLVASWAAASSWRERLAAWTLFALAGVLEIGVKHLGLGGSGVDAGVYLVRNPEGRLRMVQHVLNAVVSRVRLQGSFPSGHVLRLTLIAGCLVPTPNRGLALTVGVLSCFAAVTVGGHTIAEGIGGLALAMTGLALLRRI